MTKKKTKSIIKETERGPKYGTSHESKSEAGQKGFFQHRQENEAHQREAEGKQGGDPAVKTNIYSIHDRLAGTYSAPMLIPEKIVMRQLQYIISDMTRLDVQDKECCMLGSFDNETGAITANKPLAIADLTKLKEKMEEQEHAGNL